MKIVFIVWNELYLQHILHSEIRYYNMCYTTHNSAELAKLATRFNINPKYSLDYAPSGVNVGFAFPQMPVIRSQERDRLTMMTWGLMPSWSQDFDFRRNTLNARVETIDEKPSFRSYVQNRCLILVDGFYEWQWLDSKGKEKKKYFLSAMDGEPYAIAGIYHPWINKQSGEIIDGFSVVTAAANEQMSRIHNSKNRMPIVLHRTNEQAWLDGGDMNQFLNIPLLKEEVMN
jgi:putative SOS response-associated peptidase YedK